MLSNELEYCLNDAFHQARESRHEYLTVEHLLLAIIDTPKVRDVLRAAAVLAARHINERHLPDKALDVVDEAGARARLRRNTAWLCFSLKIATSTLPTPTSFLPLDCTWNTARCSTRWKPSVGWTSRS